jgi:hypothetical protein
LCGHTVSEKLLEIPVFGPSLINQLQLLGSQQYLQSGVLLTSLSAWGTENSLVEINLESIGSDKGSKLANTCSFVGRCIMQKEKISRVDVLFHNPKKYSLGDVQRFCCHSWSDSAVIFY